MKLVVLFLCFFFTHPGFSQDAEETQQTQKEEIKKNEIYPVKQFEELSIFDDKLHKQLKKTFKEAKLWEKKREDVKKMIVDGSKGKTGEKIFKQFPSLLEFSTDLIRDEKAMPDLIQILSMKKELKQYFLIWLVLLVGTWLIKKFLFPPEPNFMRRLFTNVIFSIGTSAVSLAVFYMFFKDQLDPAIHIFSKHFL